MKERRPIGKIFNILTLILVPTEHTQVNTVELATFLFDFLFNFFLVIFPFNIFLINSLECFTILVFSIQYQVF